jgi:hypothetical protein
MARSRAGRCSAAGSTVVTVAGVEGDEDVGPDVVHDGSHRGDDRGPAAPPDRPGVAQHDRPGDWDEREALTEIVATVEALLDE